MPESSHVLTTAEKETEFSVSELSNALKNTLESKFNRVRVRGEISGLKVHTSGHAYFALKDDAAVLDGVCWRGMYNQLGLIPQDGMDVICQGRITTFPGRSKYQIIVDTMELAGQGALLQILEARKKKLAEEGLFAAERKKALPYLPQVIGVVTSPTGAVIRDILHRLEDRFPCQVLVWPVLVQGQGAAEQIAEAIYGFNAISNPTQRPDLLIVARGGGSLEDLWSFNEEIVIRAAAASQIPLISAVGHETDITLLDYVADKRAPTPTAAAEMAVPVRLDLQAKITDRTARLKSTLSRYLNERRMRLLASIRGLPNLSYRLEDLIQKLDDRQDRLRQSLLMFCQHKQALFLNNANRLRHPKELIETRKTQLDHMTKQLHQAMTKRQMALENQLVTLRLLLKSYSFHQTLERGFTIIKDAEGKPISSIQNTQPHQHIDIIFKDGSVGAEIKSKLE